MIYQVEEEQPQVVKKSRFTKLLKFTVPKLAGKFGLSLMIGKKELFLGMAVADIEIEKVVRQKRVPVMKKQATKAKVSTWFF